MPTRDDLASALRKADAAGATDDAKRLADAIRAMDAQGSGQGAPANPFPAEPASMDAGEAARGAAKIGAGPLGDKILASAGKDFSEAMGRSDIGALVPLASAAVKGVAGAPFALWDAVTKHPRETADMAGHLIVESTGAGSIARLNGRGDLVGTPTDETYDPTIDVASLGLGAMFAGARGEAGGVVNSRFAGTELGNAVKDALTNVTVGGSDLAMGSTNLAKGVVNKFRSGKTVAEVAKIAPEAAKPFSQPAAAPPNNLILHNLDRVIGGAAGATIGGGGSASADPGDGVSGGGSSPVGAVEGAVIGALIPRVILQSGRRVINGFASLAGNDERVASNAVRKQLRGAGMRRPDDAAAVAAARFGDKPSAVADLTQEGVGTTAGLARLPGVTGDAANARHTDLVENRTGRLERDIGDTTGLAPQTVTGDLEAMQARAREAARPEYDALRANHGTLIHPQLDELKHLDVMRPHIRAADQFKQTMETTEGRGVGDFEYWDLVKRSLDDTERSLAAAGKPVPYDLDSARQSLVKTMDSLVPDYAKARELGGEAPKMGAAFKQGQTLLGGRYTAEDVGRMVSGLTGQPLDATKAGVIRSLVAKTEGARGAMTSLMSTGARRRLAQVFGQDVADAMQARFKADATIVENAGRMNPNVGSVTSQAQLGGGGIGHLIEAGVHAVRNPVESALAWIGKSGGYTRNQRDLMGQMLLEGPTEENLARIYRRKPGSPPSPVVSPSGAPPAIGPEGGTVKFKTPSGQSYSVDFDAPDKQGRTGIHFAPSQNWDKTPANSLTETQDILKGVIQQVKNDIAQGGKPAYRFAGNTDQKRRIFGILAKRTPAPDGYHWASDGDVPMLIRDK